MPTTDPRHIDIGPHRHARDEQALEHSKQMTDADDSGGVGRSTHDEPFDREISLKGILGSGVVLVVVTLISAALMWWMLRAFHESDLRKDPPASPIPAAREVQPPPGPHLQTDDKKDMRGMRDREDAVLNEPAWVDQGQGTARIPIGAAMEAIAGRGLAPVGGGTQPNPIQPNSDGQAPGALNQMARPPVAPNAPPQ